MDDTVVPVADLTSVAVGFRLLGGGTSTETRSIRIFLLSIDT